MKKIMLLIAVVVLVMALSPATALAGPPTPPKYGKWNPIPELVPPPPPLPPGWTWETLGVEKVKPLHGVPTGESVRIIKDPLTDPGAVEVPDPPPGWVSFWCQSNIGFQYHIGANGLDPNSTYTVTSSMDILRPAIVVDPGPPVVYEPGAFEFEPGFFVVKIGEVSLDLGTLHTDANGLGSVQGIEKLAPGLYELVVEVIDGDDNPILDGELDPQGFMVY